MRTIKTWRGSWNGSKNCAKVTVVPVIIGALGTVPTERFIIKCLAEISVTSFGIIAESVLAGYRQNPSQILGHLMSREVTWCLSKILQQSIQKLSLMRIMTTIKNFTFSSLVGLLLLTVWLFSRPALRFKQFPLPPSFHRSLLFGRLRLVFQLSTT